MWFILNQLFTSGVDNYLNFSELILLSNCTRITREQSTGILQYFTVTLHCEKSPFNWLTVHALLYLLCFPCLMKIEQTLGRKKKVVSLSTLKNHKYYSKILVLYTKMYKNIYMYNIYTVKKYSIIISDC